MVKRLAFSLWALCLFCVFPANAQDTIIIKEVMPIFPGGESGLVEFLQKNIVYPKEAERQKLRGEVYIRFTVDSLGDVQGVRVLRGVHPLLDNEALRVVKMMPKWQPGTQAGKAVNVSFNLPIHFDPKKKK